MPIVFPPRVLSYLPCLSFLSSLSIQSILSILSKESGPRWLPWFNPNGCYTGMAHTW